MGSLTLLIQRERPGAAQEANWLPATDGAEEQVLAGQWQHPPVRKA